MPEVTIEPLIGPYGLGEGPHWDHIAQKLYFVDIFAQKIFRYDPKTLKLTHIYLPNGPVGFVIPVEGTTDQFVAGCATDLVAVSWDGEQDVARGTPRTLVTLDSSRTETRWNDAKADSSGRLWGGTMGFVSNGAYPPDVGSFYSIGSDLLLKKHLTSVTISNGIAWSPSNDVLYYIDSPTCKIVAFDYNSQAGTIDNKRTIFDLRARDIAGFPDGMTIDTDGNLWVAVYGGGGVLQINPNTGDLLRFIKLNTAKNVTSVAFGGPELDILYATTANMDVDESQSKAQPHAGYLFAIKGLGVRGFHANSFKLTHKLT